MINMARKSVLAIGFIIAVGLGGGLGFLVSYLVIGPSPPPYTPDPTGRVIQTQFKSIGDYAEIFNYTTTVQTMPGTSLPFDKGELTYLYIRFTCPYRHVLSDGLRYKSSYIINLEINGEIKINASIEHWQDGGDPLLGPHYYTGQITLEYVTEVLDPGVYDIGITWVSTSLCTSNNLIYSSDLQVWVGTFQFNRTLLVQEIFI
jgi:hypothetical protein